MYRKILELKSSRADELQKAEQAIKQGDGAAYDQAMAKVKDLNEDLSRVEALVDEQNRYGKGADIPGTAPGQTPEEPGNSENSEELSKLLRSAEYKKTFLQALKEGISPKRFTKGYEPLYKAMTISGGDPAGSEGGFLVPDDFETRVIELAKEMVDLAAYANVEPVLSPVGWRNVELSAARTRMSVVGEGQPIPSGEGPKFKRVDFSCKVYGDRILISGELMENTDALMDYLAKWFAAKYVATKNGLIMDKLSALAFTPISGETDGDIIASVKGILNKDLRTAVSKRSVLLTNQDGYDKMDNLVDDTGRAFLKPDISGDFDRFKNRPVVYGDNDVLENFESAGAEYAPLYVGDLASFVSLFIRKGMRMDVTNVGGEAWAAGGYEVRVMCSMDAQIVDDTAMVKRGFGVT